MAKLDHTNVDCVAVSILSHGQADLYTIKTKENIEKTVIADMVIAHDQPVPLKDLTSILSATNPKMHPSLIGKPKLFFIQVSTCNLCDVSQWDSSPLFSIT